MYATPDSRLLPEDQWGEAPRPYSVDRKELLAMAHRWDAVGRLALFPSSGEGAPDPLERCMAFVVPKPGTDPPETRQILDRRARNRKEETLRTGSKWLPQGSMWLDLFIPEGMAAYVRAMLATFVSCPRLCWPRALQNYAGGKCLSGRGAVGS